MKKNRPKRRRRRTNERRETKRSAKRRRGRSTAPPRVAGHAGMPMAEWRDWRQVAETFVAERPCANPELVVEVLVLALGLAPSWADLVGAGRWVMLASVEVFVSHVPGYRAGRTYALLDRFTRWLFARGDITPWQRDVMRSEIDEQRIAHGCADRGVRRVRELRFGYDADRTVDAWIEAEGGLEGQVARSAIRVLVGRLARQLGESCEPPLGSLDVNALVAEVVEVSPGGPSDAERALLATLSSFYRWLAETERLEPSRARAIAQLLASAALGLATSAARVGAA